MPELPEVETFVRALQGPMLGRTFVSVIITWPNLIRPSAAELQKKLPGLRVERLTRRGKYLQFRLSEGQTLFIHLKMSGSLTVEPAEAPLHRHVRTIFNLDNGYQLRFKDMRKFGRVHLVDDPARVTGHLGPEPLDPHFTAEDFVARCRRRSGRLKPLLLNQSFIAGVGNIYADESCFAARLHPRRRVGTFSDEALTRLYHALQKNLNAGIMLKGASIDAVYGGGQFQNHFQVYGRGGQPCPVCATPIKRIVLGGRSTHFCPRCQPEE